MEHESRPNEYQVVQPQPTPETWQTQILPNRMVVIIISSVTGTHVSFMDADNAARIGQSVLDAGRQAASGLIIPQGDFTLPHPNGNNTS